MNKQERNFFLLLKRWLPAGFLLTSGVALWGQPMNPHAVMETPSGWVASPDLDGDGEPDLVLLDRVDGVLRPALVSGGTANWLTPVASGVADVDALAAGPFGPGGEAAVAVTSEEANRINVFGFDGSGLDPVPESIFPPLVGMRELATIPEGSADDDGTSAATVPWELLAYSELHDPTESGAKREFLRQTGSGLGDYGTPFENAPTLERDHGAFWVEEELPLLGYFRETPAPGDETFVLYYTEDGGFEIVDTENVPEDSRVVHASFDGSGDYQFVFHVPGTAQITVLGWDGSSDLNPVGTFALSEPAAAVFPFADGSEGRLLAVPMSGTGLREYSFDGASAPVAGAMLNPLSGLPVTAAMAGPGGSLFVFSSGDDSGKAEAAELFQFDGSQFQSQGSLALPASPGGAANVLLFGDTPLVEENPELTGRWQSGVWTSAVSLGGGVVEAKEESYDGPVAGLDNPVTKNLGTPPAGTVGVLGNQVARDISLHDPRPAVGSLPAAFLLSPASGEYNESVTVQVTPRNMGTWVVYRELPDGGWQLAGSSVGPFYRDVQLQFYGFNGGERSPLQTVHYTFSHGPGDLDSDEDGVPDVVEIANGLDPVVSEDDGDGDGFSDFLELMAGTDPADETETPLPREQDSDGDGYSDFEEQLAGTDPGNGGSAPAGSVLNLQSVFDVVAVPQSHDGTTAADPLVASLDEATESAGESLATPVRLFNLAGSLLGYDRTRDHGIAGVSDPSALFEEVSGGGGSRMPMVLATGTSFPVDVASGDAEIGRQVAGLVKPPQLEAPEFSFTFGNAGGSTTAEASAWVSTVKSQLLSQQREQVIEELDFHDTLVLLLVEYRLEQILKNRGLLPGPDQLTLTGFRNGESAVGLSEAPGDGSRPVQPDMAVFREIQREFVDSGSGVVDTGFRLGIVMDAGDGVIQTPPNGNVTALREVAEGLYRVSAAQGNDDPGSLLPPMEALRRFIRTGSLADTGYPVVAPGAPFDSGTLASASAGVSYFLGLGLNRPISQLDLTVTSSTDGSSGTCTVLLDDAVNQAVSLVDFKGNPYALPDAFELPAGSVLRVRGYTDVDPSCGADLGMEVIPTVDLIELPAAATTDSNGDLIPDDLEDLYTTGLSAFGDSDGDGFSDLQEILDGSDPVDGGSAPAGGPVDLGPPEVTLTSDGSGNLIFSFAYPAAYVGDLTFDLYSAADLTSEPVPMGVEASHDGSGQMSLQIPQPDGGDLPQFWRFKLGLD